MLNQVILVGRLVNDPEVIELESGKKVSNITLAVPRSYKNENGEYDTDFLKCTLWQMMAENTTAYCKKGDTLGVKGRVETRTYEDENGKHTVQEIMAEKVSFLSSRKEKEEDSEMEV